MNLDDFRMEESEYKARGVTAFHKVSLGTYSPRIYSAFRWQWSIPPDFGHKQP